MAGTIGRRAFWKGGSDMKPYHSVIHGQKAPQRPGYFRTSFSVMADTFKDIYGIRPKDSALPKQAPHMVLPDQKSPDSIAPAADHPSFRKWLGRGMKYAYWFGLSQVAKICGKVVGQSVAFTAIIYHPFFVSSALRIKRSGQEEKVGDEAKQQTSFKEKAVSAFKNLRAIVAPDRATQVLTYCILEMASTPVFISTIVAVASLTTDTVSPLLAVASVTAGTGVALALEYVGYRALWKNVVLRGIDRGSIKDDLKGFIEEFKPLRLFGLYKKTKPAETACEYVGQTYGVIESYWIWVQAGRLALAGVLASLFSLTPTDFIGAYLGSVLSWYGIAVDLMLPMYIEAMKDKLRANNRHLDLEGER